ncbi:MAG: glycosyltransferase family 4 protein, partial [Gammaproteobacteria bacterium]|nr:glycosyltransferase family 4 protein [Gammaproteobacteria bacterium]
QVDGIYNDQLRSAGLRLVDFVPQKKFDRHAVQFVRDYVIAHDIEVVYAFNNPAIITCNRALRGLKHVGLVTYRGQTGNLSRWDPTCYLTHLNPRVDLILGVSNAVRDSVKLAHPSPDKAETVYKGHDLDWYKDKPIERSKIGVPADAFVVGCVANNRPRKGVRVLIAATHHLQADANIHIVLVGAGMDDSEISKQIAASPFSDRFHIMGYRNDSLAIISACDVSVLPSVKREGLPKTVIEAMVYETTPVVTTAGGSPELIKDGVTGFIVPVEDPEAMAEKIQWLYEHPETCKEMGQKARLRIAEHFNVKDSARRTKELMEALITRKRAS